MSILVTNPKQFLRVVFREMQMYLSTEITYRWQVFVWVLSDAVQPLLLGFVWTAVARAGNGSMSVSEVISYFFMVAIVAKLTKDWSVVYISNSVISGDFSKYLVKPFNYLTETLGISFAVRVLRFALLLPMLALGFLVLKGSFIYVLTLENILLSILALVLGFGINYLLGNTFALSAFFINQILGLRAFYENVAMFLSGEGIPISAFPVWALGFVQVLPFRYTVSFPIEILMGTISKFEMIKGFGIAIFWLLILVVVYKLLFKMAIKRYEGHGI